MTIEKYSVTIVIYIKSFTLTGCDDDNGAEESDLRVWHPELVEPLGEVEHGVHEELGVAGRHPVDGVLPDDVPVQTHQALNQTNS